MKHFLTALLLLSLLFQAGCARSTPDGTSGPQAESPQLAYEATFDDGAFSPIDPAPYATICWKSGSASWMRRRPKPCFSRRIPSWKKTAGRTRVPPHKDNNKIPFRAMQEGGNRYTFGCRPLVL